MPLNSLPPATTPAGLAAKAAAIPGTAWIDVGLWGGLVPESARGLGALAAAGALGFKCFLCDSGVEEFPPVVAEDLRRASPDLAALGLPLLAHAEAAALLAPARRDLDAAARRSYAAYLESRPAAAEVAAIAALLDLCREAGFPLHIVHLSAAAALPLLRAARREGLPVTVETCPHYLTFAAEEIPDGATIFKCAPPIRERANRERLWTALAEGDIDLVASDHSPAPPALKRLEDGDFPAAWGGIASLQLALPAVWTGLRQRGLPLESSLELLARWMSREPARLAGIAGRKGALAPGHDADLVIWDPDAAFRVDPAALEHRHPLTPYAGRELRGVVQATFLRGEAVYQGGGFAGCPRGRQLRPGPR
jgi:allantoinase